MDEGTPPMMTFKSFVERCSDGVSEEEALAKYSEYKLKYKKKQLTEFFIAHKEEEWYVAMVTLPLPQSTFH